MTTEFLKATDKFEGGMIANTGAGETAKATGQYFIECFDKDGNLKWRDETHNLVVNVGLQDMNTKYFSGSSYTATWYVGLVGNTASNTTFSGGDTLASHAGWTENSNYSGNRKAATFGAATLADPSNINNASSTASFTMNANATISGAFLTNVATGTSGLLFSVSDFQTPGDRQVVSGDVLNVTYSFNLDAS